MSVIVSVLPEVVFDTLKLFPFLYVSILVMEYVEHKAGNSLAAFIQRTGKYGPSVGSAMGLIPQCGFSAACAQLFNAGLISAGTLCAVFLSTSDEAIPLMLSHADRFLSIVVLMAVKLCAALVFGYLLDALWSREKQAAYFKTREHDHHCGIQEENASFWGIAFEALKRTLQILLFVFIISVLVESVVEFVGVERMSTVLLPGVFQPFVAGVLGFIPGCAASVLLTELFLDGMISFGSAIAGLCTGAGMGLLILLRGKHDVKVYIYVLGGLYLFSSVLGFVIQLVTGI